MLFYRFSATVSVLSLLPAVVLGNSGNCSDVSPGGIRHSTVPQITLPLRRESATPLPSLVSVRHPVSHVECIVKPLGFGRDDSAHILDAVALCGQGGTITLPAPYVYTVSQRLYMHLDHARLNVYGIMSFTPNLGYWIENSHRIGFQNQSTSWVISGNDFVVDGGGWQQGGIQGNGQAWYTRAQGRSNQFGRPIPLSIYNSTNVTITNFSVYEPQFWSFWIQDSSNIYLRGVYINGTNTDPAGNGSNYAINLDGVNTYRVDNLIMENSAFQGGDDCFTPKGNSTNIILKNITCVGGGIAFGSVGQYPGFPDYIANFTASEIHVAQNVHPLYGGAKVAGGAYFKSWVGFEAGEPPQGGGGGTGRVNNVTFHNLSVHNTTQAIFINKCYYKVAEQANYCDTSTFKFEDLSFYNISGTTSTSVGIALNCSVAAPCSNVAFSDVSLVQDLGNSTHTRCVNARNVTGVRCS